MSIIHLCENFTDSYINYLTVPVIRYMSFLPQLHAVFSGSLLMISLFSLLPCQILCLSVSDFDVELIKQGASMLRQI